MFRLSSPSDGAYINTIDKSCALGMAVTAETSWTSQGQITGHLLREGLSLRLPSVCEVRPALRPSL